MVTGSLNLLRRHFLLNGYFFFMGFLNKLHVNLGLAKDNSNPLSESSDEKN